MASIRQDNMIREMETIWNGDKCRSKAEAQWAVFFNRCHLNYQYEPQDYGVTNENGQKVRYLPDFFLPNITLRATHKTKTPMNLFVEIKGGRTYDNKYVIMTKEDDEKIQFFSNHWPILVLGRIPNFLSTDDLFHFSQFVEPEYDSSGTSVYYAAPFNFWTIDHDWYPALPGINRDGQFDVFSPKCMDACDTTKTLRIYREAFQAKFDHGLAPVPIRIKGGQSI